MRSVLIALVLAGCGSSSSGDPTAQSRCDESSWGFNGICDVGCVKEPTMGPGCIATVDGGIDVSCQFTADYNGTRGCCHNAGNVPTDAGPVAESVIRFDVCKP